MPINLLIKETAARLVPEISLEWLTITHTVWRTPWEQIIIMILIESEQSWRAPTVRVNVVEPNEE